MSNMTLAEQLVLLPLLRIHGVVYRKTNGRIGHQMPGMPPCLLLHTIGAKTGQQRSKALIYAKDGDSYLVVASFGGSDKHPGWYYNLRANPSARVTIEGDTWDATARLATPDERKGIWARGVRMYPGLSKEEVWAGDRRIEAFVLERH